jgi:hypothetical protein
VSTLAGTDTSGHNDGDVTSGVASFTSPRGVAVLPDGSIVISEASNPKLRKLRFNADGHGSVSTLNENKFDDPQQISSYVNHFSSTFYLY